MKKENLDWGAGSDNVDLVGETSITEKKDIIKDIDIVGEQEKENSDRAIELEKLEIELGELDKDLNRLLGEKNKVKKNKKTRIEAKIADIEQNISLINNRINELTEDGEGEDGGKMFESEKGIDKESEKDWDKLESDMYEQLREKLKKEYDEAGRKKSYIEKTKINLGMLNIENIDQDDENLLNRFGFSEENKADQNKILALYKKVGRRALGELEPKETEETNNGKGLEGQRREEAELRKAVKDEVKEAKDMVIEKVVGEEKEYTVNDFAKAQGEAEAIKNFTDEKIEQEKKWKNLEGLIKDTVEVEYKEGSSIRILFEKEGREKAEEQLKGKGDFEGHIRRRLEHLGLDPEDEKNFERAKEMHLRMYDELLDKIESEQETEPEIIETPEIKTEIETEPKTTREVIEQLGLLEELEVFERILADKERDLAEIENYINNKKRGGEEITQEDEDRRNKASEEVQRADINVNTARGVGASLEVEKDTEDEKRILEKKIRMQNLLLTQFEVLGKIKGIEDKNVEKLSPKKQRAAKRFVGAVVDKLPKRFTYKGGDGGGGEQTEEPKKVGRLEKLQNLVERKLFGNSAESENSELKNAVAVEILKIIADKKRLFKKFEGNEGKSIKIEDIGDENMEEIINGLPDELRNKQGIGDEIKNLRFKREYLEEVIRGGDETEKTFKISGETKSAMKENFKEIIDKKHTGDMMLCINKSLSDDNLHKDFGKLGNSPFSPFYGYMGKDAINILHSSGMGYNDIENVDVREFMEEFKKIYEEVKGETGEIGETEKITEEMKGKIKTAINSMNSDEFKKFEGALRIIRDDVINRNSFNVDEYKAIFGKLGIEYNEIKDFSAKQLIGIVEKIYDGIKKDEESDKLNEKENRQLGLEELAKEHNITSGEAHLDGGNKVRFLEKRINEEKEKFIKNCKSFEELDSVLDRIDKLSSIESSYGLIKGKIKNYKIAEIKSLINRLRIGEIKSDGITRSLGLKEKVEELIAKEKSKK
jgi:hypothetical protein